MWFAALSIDSICAYYRLSWLSAKALNLVDYDKSVVIIKSAERDWLLLLNSQLTSFPFELLVWDLITISVEG